jgi:hypothetical protein
MNFGAEKIRSGRPAASVEQARRTDPVRAMMMSPTKSSVQLAV